MATPQTLQFLGAAGTVTGSKYLVQVGERRVLVDCGMFQGEKKWREQNWADFPVDAATITDVLLTHAHADHCAYLPAIVARGFNGTIWGTEGTVRLAEIVLMDAARLQEREAMQANEGGYSKHSPALPVYTVADAEATIPLFRTIGFDSDIDLGGGLVARWTRAGHILGSASINLTLDDTSILFSGDLGRHDHPVLRSRDVPPGAPYVLIESTYGDREHPDPEAGAHRQFAETITRTIARGGSVLIPAFAVDRTEIVLKTLHEMVLSREIPSVPIFVNSPMAVAALAVYRAADARGELRDLDEIDNFANLPNLREITDPEDSKALNHPKEPSIIISSSGMASGGRVLHHLEAMLPDPRNTVILTGYQGVGTRGRTLIEGAKQVKIRGRYIPVKAEIYQDKEFSVHADASDLIDWLRDLSPRPETVFCVHGDPESAAALAAKIHRELGLSAVVPTYKEKVSILASGELKRATSAPDVNHDGTPVARAAALPAAAVQPGGTEEAAAVAATPSGPLYPRMADSHSDDLPEVRIILDTALGQVKFLPEEKRSELVDLLNDALNATKGENSNSARIVNATNLALYAAAGVVETPGGQSIVALLAHIPKILR